MKSQKGFTLLELIIVITLIGLIASVIMVSLSESRKKSRNEAVVSQMYEYQKSIELNYSNTGVYPHPDVGASRSNILCIGDGELVVGQPCMSISTSYGNGSKVVEDALKNFMPYLPRFKQPAGIYSYSSPAYSGCSSFGPTYTNADNDRCAESNYSFWYVLEGTNEDCGGRAQVAEASYQGEYTLCRLQSE